MRELKFKIGIVEYNFVEVIDEWIAKEYRDEAYEIVGNILDWHDFNAHHLLLEWCIYIERKMGNIICMQLDKMKYDLVKARIMKNEGHFGSPYTDEFPDDWFENGPDYLNIFKS